MIIVGIIGGSGLDNPDIICDRQEIRSNTPFGEPSDSLISGTICGVKCILLSRHGRNHTINPTNVNYRANIWALKEAGCTVIIATNAVGALKNDILPGHIVLLDQFIDRTTNRIQTFYDGTPSSPKGVCHIPMAQPFNKPLTRLIAESLDELNLATYHDNGCIIVIEGPRFSTKAESKIWQSYGATVIGMTNVPEVVLANEAATPYATICLVTDNDTLNDHEDKSVSVELVIRQMKSNAEVCLKLLKTVIPKIAKFDWTDELKKQKQQLESSIML